MRWILSFLLAAAVALVLVSVVQAQEQKSEDRASGIVTSFEKSTGTVTLRDRRESNIIRTVLISSETKLQFEGKPATQDQIALKRSLVCVGKFEGVKLRAERCEIR